MSLRSNLRRLGWVVALALPLAAHAEQKSPGPGDKAPDFAGRSYEGQPVSVSAYAGRVVVLSFWASWCGPCRKELPILEGIQQAAGKQRIQVIAVNIESLDTFRKIARKMTSLRLMVASDTGEEAQHAYGVNGIPHLVIIDKSGTIVRVKRGYNEAGVDQVVDDLNRALAAR